MTSVSGTVDESKPVNKVQSNLVIRNVLIRNKLVLRNFYQRFYTINLLLDKELLPIKKMTKLGIIEHKIVKISKKKGLLNMNIIFFVFYSSPRPRKPDVGDN